MCFFSLFLQSTFFENISGGGLKLKSNSEGCVRRTSCLKFCKKIRLKIALISLGTMTRKDGDLAYLLLLLAFPFNQG